MLQLQQQPAFFCFLQTQLCALVPGVAPSAITRGLSLAVYVHAHPSPAYGQKMVGMMGKGKDAVKDDRTLAAPCGVSAKQGCQPVQESAALCALACYADSCVLPGRPH